MCKFFEVLTITPKELTQILKSICLVDIRESYKWQVSNIPLSVNWPFSKLAISSFESIPKSIKESETVVIYCQHGFKSHAAIQTLFKKLPGKKFLNLSGGYTAWNEM